MKIVMVVKFVKEHLKFEEGDLRCLKIPSSKFFVTFELDFLLT